MSTNSNSSSIPPEPQGRYLHDDYQQCDSLVNDIPSLLKYLKEDKGEEHTILDINSLQTWLSFAPKNEEEEDTVAFWTPTSCTEGASTATRSYDTLTYAQLYHEIRKCPSFDVGSGVGGVAAAAVARVAIAMPADEMAHTATALLATMAQPNATAVPLGPRIAWDAIQQLKCRVLVVSKTLLHEGFVMEKKEIRLDSTTVNEKDRSYARHNLEEIRVVVPDVCGRLEWSLYRKSESDDASWVEMEDTDSLAASKPTIVTPDDTTPVLLLRTSGTTALPKVVPITRTHLFYAAKTIGTTLELTRSDCCVNAMPLFHIGGIACNLLAVLISGGSVVMQGPFSDPMAFLGHIITTTTTTPVVHEKSAAAPRATWYYAAPSMHKAVALMAQARPSRTTNTNHLRFIRSASAHMPHDLALQLSELLDCGVIPTYGMSEAMPICSSIPIRYNDHEKNCAVDSVGYPTGSNVKIVNPETHTVLPFGPDEIGEICVKGAGVITHYENLDTGFTNDGWLLTGDLGMLDRQGRLFIKGRSKELIKRGGEQIWPNQVDGVVQNIEGVATAVTFGVLNPLFGEEVATAVVTAVAEVGHEVLRQSILQACKQQLEPNAIPQQIIFLPSTDHLLKGSTGKYLRSKMADHLNLQAVDTGALKMLESVTALSGQPTDLCIGEDPCCEEGVPMSMYKGEADAKLRVLPHESLNGLRFLVACFVVHVHVGLFPNLTWIKMQSYTPNMMVFMALGAFQTTCSLARPVRGQWATWVGTKIGSLHALFVISQFFNLPSYTIWYCTDEAGDFVCDAYDYIDIFVRFLIGTTTGLMHGLDVNLFAWFQSTFYLFLIFFPFFDDFLRRRSLVPTLSVIMIAGLAIAASLYVVVGNVVPSEIFNEYVYLVQFSMLSWGWYLLASMCAAYFFRRSVLTYVKEQKDANSMKDPTEMTEDEHRLSLDGSEDNNIVDMESLKEYTKCWGYVCDCCSLILLGIWIMIALWQDSLCLKPETIEAMRGLEELVNVEECHRLGISDQYWVHDITYQEFVEHVHPDLDYNGRFDSTVSIAFGFWKLACPLFLLWIYAMAYGNSITSRFLGHRIMTSMAPLGYPIYLLHYGVARYYWLATRGLESKDWWIEAGIYPFPVEWYEYFIILGTAVVLGLAVTRWLVPILMPRTISWGVTVCSWMSRRGTCCLSMCPGQTSESHIDDDSTHTAPASTFDQIKSMVRGLTGLEVGRSTDLRSLGLDSLGATALLGMLRASVPAAKGLTLQHLQSCETVGDLANVLDAQETVA